MRIDTDPSGNAVSALMAPSLIASQRLRGVAFRGNMILTGSAAPGYIHTPSSASLQPMRLAPPAYAPDLLGVTKLSTEVGLTGSYRVRLSFAIKGIDGRIITESPLGPAAITPSDLATQSLRVSAFQAPPEDINTIRLYRTLSGASSTYYRWLDLDTRHINPVGHMIADATPDEVITGTPAPLDSETGLPPNQFKLLVSWGGRLVGVDASDNGRLIWSEVGFHDRWPATNSLPIPPTVRDGFGVTALLPRRNTLGIARRGSFHLVSDLATPELHRIGDEDVISHDAAVTHNDVVWVLTSDGIYRWDGSNRLSNISAATVHPWFTTNTYFTRDKLHLSIGTYNIERRSIIWLLPSAGQSSLDDTEVSLDRWIEYYPDRDVWLGPHVLSAGTFGTPTTVGLWGESGNIVAIGTANGQILTEDTNQHFDADSAPQVLSVDSPRLKSVYITPNPLPVTVIAGLPGEPNITEGTATLPRSPEGNGRVAGILDGTPFITPVFPWTSTNAMFWIPVTATQAIGLRLVGTSLNIIIPNGTTLDALSAFELDPAAPPTDQASLAEGVEVVLETQPLTLGLPTAIKEFGELFLVGDADSGHNLTTMVGEDGFNLTYPHPLRGTARLDGRVGEDSGPTLRITETTTADVRLSGYHIMPVSIRRH